MKQNIWGKNLPELRTLMKELGAPGYRSQQLFDYMYKRGILHFDEMAQLPKALRNKLIESWVIDFPTIVREQRSSDRKTASTDEPAVRLFRMHFHTGRVRGRLYILCLRFNRFAT